MQLLLRPQTQYPALRFQCAFIILMLLLASHTAKAAVTEPAAPLTLIHALNLAQKANPDIAIALHEREAVLGIQTQASIRPNPTISTSIQDTRSDTRQIYLQLNQELEMGNKRDARIAAADSFYSKADAELDYKRVEIHANVVAAFYGVLAAQERLILAQSSLEVANLALDAATKRVKAGKSAPVEQTKSKIAESGAKIDLNQALSQLTMSRKRLTALWGNAIPQFEVAEGVVASIPETSSLGELDAMLENAPAIKLAKLEVNAREALTKVERSKATPNITISAGMINNQELGLNQALLGLIVPIPLFDRNQGNLQEAVSRKYKAEDTLVALKNQLGADLSAQFERLSVAKQSSEALRTEILPSAQSAFDVANRGFSAGKFNFIDVLDAQRTLFHTKSQFIQTLLEAHQAVAEIERILGDVINHPLDIAQE